MEHLNLTLSPLQAAAFRSIDAISAAYICRLAMDWLETEPNSISISSLASEGISSCGDLEALSWSDIATTFNSVLCELRVPKLEDSSALAIRIVTILEAFSEDKMNVGDLYNSISEYCNPHQRLLEQTLLDDPRRAAITGTNWDKTGLGRIREILDEFDIILWGGNSAKSHTLKKIESELNEEVSYLLKLFKKQHVVSL